MKLRLIGHDYKYAAEQIMLMMFPGERPQYTDSHTDGDFCAEIALLDNGGYIRAETVIYSGADSYSAESCAETSEFTDELERDRVLQRIIKQSFYKAALNLTDEAPPWGALTGIRPAKLYAAMLESGLSELDAVQKLRGEYYVSPQRAELCAAAAKSTLAVKKTLSPRDIAIYVGIPFCPTRCAYCSFVSNSVEKSFGLIEPFLKALSDEINAVSRLIKKLGFNIVSVYIGGGTPTALSPEQLGALLEKIGSSFDLSAVREYTVEAGRPDTVTDGALSIIKKHATRVSVNPQTMSAEVLRLIGRSHTPEDFINAAELVRGHSALEMNCDLIAGLPGDSVSGFCRSLETVMAQNPENITVHTLSLKKGSRITLEGTPIPAGHEVREMLGYASKRLSGAGYSPYYLYRQKFTSGGFENVGWARPGHEGIYNICMMEEVCSVLALGGGGVTKLILPGGRIERIFNVKYPREYIDRTEMPDEKVRRIEEFYAE